MTRIRVIDDTSEIWFRTQLDARTLIPILRQFLEWRRHFVANSIDGDVGLPPEVERSSGWLILLGVRQFYTQSQMEPKSCQLPIELDANHDIDSDQLIYQVDLDRQTIRYLIKQVCILDENQSIETINRLLAEAMP